MLECLSYSLRGSTCNVVHDPVVIHAGTSFILAEWSHPQGFLDRIVAHAEGLSYWLRGIACKVFLDRNVVRAERSFPLIT